MIRFAVVTDIHYGRDRDFRLGTKAPGLLHDFVKAVNRYQPDFVADLGDRIDGCDEKSDLSNMRKLKAIFNKIVAPVYSIIGNNDLRKLTRKQNRQVMGAPSCSYSRDVKGYHLIFWNPDVDTDKTEGLELPEQDLQWLRQELEKTDKPVIIFSHIPFTEHPAYGPFTHKRKDIPNVSYYPNSAEIQKVIANSGKVILCISGHLHGNEYHNFPSNPTHYLTQRSLIDRKTEGNREPCNAYSFIEIDDHEIRVKGYGYKQPSYTLPI